MFSGALTLTDLNDFITPSQACIKPVEEVKPADLASQPGAAATEIQVDSSGAYYEVAVSDITKTSGPTMGTKKKLQQAEITLNDCLACSGCITSAESVLITLQSHTEVLNALKANSTDRSCVSYKVPVLSISPQSLASLATSVSSTSSAPISPLRVLRRIRAFAKTTLGFEHVFDTTFARHLALLEHVREFQERKTGTAAEKLPMLASACPGWVCYAEKTHAEMLPFIARSKSPQQVMGTLVKSWLGARWSKRADQVYHVTVMPCYDKKLEASRSDFYNELYATRDVDCVITTGELELLMREHGWDLSQSVPDEDAVSPSAVSPEEAELPELLSHPGTSSGSYMHTLIDTLQTSSKEQLELTTKTVRGADYEEYTLTAPTSGAIVFRGAKCYGFRNLQNVVRKVGRDAGVQTSRGAAGRMGGAGGARARAVARKTNGANGAAALPERGYDYVEVMACPGGCVNGGGQLRPTASIEARDTEGYARDWTTEGAAPAAALATTDVDDGGLRTQGYAGKWGDKEWTRKVEAAYWTGLPTPPPSPEPGRPDTPYARADRLATIIAGELCHPTDGKVPAGWTDTMDEKAEQKRKTLFRTNYRAVEGEVLGIAVKW